LKNGALSNKTCLDITRKLEVGFYSCHYTGGPQFIEYSVEKELRKDNYCFEFVTTLRLTGCHKRKMNQEWNYNITSFHLVHKVSKKCLASDKSLKKVIVEDCDDRSHHQEWKFQILYEDKLAMLK
jgi:polypeptide N-acetylgalactosaminyltransferase